MFTKAKYYTDIDNCPILIYHNILLNKFDVKTLCYQGKHKLKICNRHWTNIQNQVIQEWGVSSQYQEFIELQVKLCKAYVQRYTKNQRAAQNDINVYKTDIRELQEQIIKPQKIETICAHLTKEYGALINPMQVTVRMFYGFLDL